MNMLDMIAEIEMAPKVKVAVAVAEDEDMLELFKMVAANRSLGVNTSTMVQLFREKFFSMNMDDRLHLASKTSPCVAEVIKVFGVKNLDITSML